MVEEQYQSASINDKWLQNIYSQLESLENMERLAREGCASIIEYAQIPYEMTGFILPNARYKNFCFMADEIELLIRNITPILKDISKYSKRLELVMRHKDDKNLYIEEVYRNNQLVEIKVKPFLQASVKILSSIISEIITDIGHILYIKEGDNKKTW